MHGGAGWAVVGGGVVGLGQHMQRDRAMQPVEALDPRGDGTEHPGSSLVAGKLASASRDKLAATAAHGLMCGGTAYHVSISSDSPWPDAFVLCFLAHDVGQLLHALEGNLQRCAISRSRNEHCDVARCTHESKSPVAVCHARIRQPSQAAAAISPKRTCQSKVRYRRSNNND